MELNYGQNDRNSPTGSDCLVLNLPLLARRLVANVFAAQTYSSEAYLKRKMKRK